MNFKLEAFRLSENNMNHSKSMPCILLCRRFNYLLIALLLVVFAACGGDSNTTGPDPDPDPDPDRLVSFADDIAPIFNGSCAVSGCHDSGTQQNGVDLSSYSAAINSVGSQYGTEVIEPDDPSNSPVVDKIEEGNPQFGQRMPLNRSALNEAQIDSIVAWIEDGAPNN
jgi:hypothetical protein